MKALHTYTFMDKSEWPRGEWDFEPDKIEWRDEATGLPCLIVRSRSSALCGYVGIPQTHHLHGIDYTEMDDIDVHGGLTFSDHCDPRGDENPHLICHVPLLGEDDRVWWFGFDCAHFMDQVPAFSKFSDIFSQGAYRNVAYVEAEVTRLAEQLKMRELEVGELLESPKELT